QSGNLSSSILWSSSLQGALGTGASIATLSLAAGTHIITAKCTDPGGLVGQASINVIITGGTTNTPPVVTISAPANNSSVAYGAATTFTGSATDQQSGNLTSSMTSSSSIQGTLGTGGSITVSNLAVGTHTITARVTDPGGLQGTASITVVVGS